MFLNVDSDEDGLPIFEGCENLSQLLDERPDGTYLIEKIVNGTYPYKIYIRRYSATTGEIKVKKIKVLSVNDGSAVKYMVDGNKQKFSSLKDLIVTWRPEKFKFPYVSNPLVNLPYYIGHADRKEAEQLLESGKFDYVLREKENEPLRLTVKTKIGR